MKITSRDNSLLRRARSVRDGKLNSLIFVEGLRLCEEALKSELRIEAVIYTDHILRRDRAAQSIERLAAAADTAATVSEKLLESGSCSKTPQGVVVLAVRPSEDEETFAANKRGRRSSFVLHESTIR